MRRRSPRRSRRSETAYGVSEVIFVGDRAMITCANDDKVKGIPHLHDQRPHPSQIVSLLERR